MIFFTADQHFGHFNIMRLSKRPFASLDEMNEAMIARWNAKVRDEDTIYILGDLFFRAATVEAVLQRLKGRKHLILGNHDHTWTSKARLADHFESVQTICEIDIGGKPATLCHYPMLSYPQARRGYMIYGHIHNNKVGKIANTRIARVSTANANPSGNSTNKYAAYGDYVVDKTIAKEQGTAKDTCATFYCIDLSGESILAIGYGADVDREIAYGDAPTYTVTYHLRNCTSSNNSTFVYESGSYSAVLTPIDGATISSAVVTMGGADITSTAYANGVINVANVTGDLVITVSASVPLWTETVSDIAAAIRSVWSIPASGGVPNLVSSNTEIALGVTTANGSAHTDREGETVYVMPVNAKACDVEVTVTDGTACTYRFIGLKKSGSTYTIVFNTDKKDSAKHSWTAGAVDNILISLERKDGSSWAWGYDDTKIKVTFTNGGTASGGGSGGTTPTYTNMIDTAGTVDNVRIRSGGETASASGFASGYFKCQAGDTIRVYFPNGNRASIPSNGVYVSICSDTNGTQVASYSTGQPQITDETDTGYTVKVPEILSGVEYARVAGGPNGAYAGWIVTVNQEIV